MKRLLIVVALAACGGSEQVADESGAIVPDKDAIAKVVENGPVKATVKVWPAKPKLSDPIYVRLEVEAPIGVSIDAPFQEAGDQRLGRFRVVGFARDTQRTASGGQLHEQTYTLEAPTSGRHRVPPLRLEMIDARNGARNNDDAKAKPQEILTDEVPLEVEPVPTDRATAELQPALGPLDPEVGGTSWVTILGFVSLLMVLGSGGVLLYRGFKLRRRIEQQRSAYEDAIAHLDELAKRGAPDAASADSWFVELSSIVRGYLEARYEIRAPELTTEEFLLVATARPELHEDHRTQLTEFLERCDRVKFAGYRPDADESLATLEAARQFVVDTRVLVGDTRRAA